VVWTAKVPGTGYLLHDQNAFYIHHGNAASPELARNIGATEGKTSALQWNDTDIENAVWRNVDGVWAKLGYRSVVDRDAGKCGGAKKFGALNTRGRSSALVTLMIVG
jgi:hypothetical protein